MAEKNTSRLAIFNPKLCSGRMAQWYEVSFFALEEVGFKFIYRGASSYVLPFGLFLFILTAFSFARFLR